MMEFNTGKYTVEISLMYGMLDSYLQEFAKLRVDTNRSKWTEATNFKSPYKPFLLLSLSSRFDRVRFYYQEFY